MKLYKFLKVTGLSVYQAASWPLPVDGAPGAWLPAVEGPLKMCVNGYHACRAGQVALWVDQVLAEVEINGEMIGDEQKVCGRGPARITRIVEGWTPMVLREWLVDCAEHVLPVYERAYPGEARVRHCIEMTRRFLRGEATQEKLTAAMAATRAAEAAWATRAAEDAAEDAEDAARATRAAIAAAWAATDQSTELAWQSRRLLELAGETIAE